MQLGIDWDDLRYFLGVYRSGTLAGAAAKLNLNPTTVGRRLAGLESALQTTLFERTTSGYVPTEAANRLVPRAETMEREAMALQRSIAGEDARMSGTVRLTATEMLATRFVAPHLKILRERHPRIELEFICTTRTLSLARGEADILLRLARPTEDHLMIRRLCLVELGLYASRGYLEPFDTKPDPDAGLHDHDAILFADTRAFGRENRWFEPRLDGARVALRSNSGSAAYSACVGGLGIALLPCQVAERDRTLVRIGEQTGPEPREVWQAVHRDTRNNARIRAVLAFLEEVVAADVAAGG